MPDPDPYFDDVPDAPVAEAEPEAADSGADTADAPATETATEALYAGKYKSVDELVNGYKELERTFHASRQQPEPEAEAEQEAADPFGDFLGVDERIWQYAAQDPKAAFEWARSNPNQLGFQAEQIQSALFANWFQNDPIAAQRALYQQDLQAMRDELRGEFQQTSAPLQERHVADLMNNASWRANQELPAFDQYRDRIMTYLEPYRDQVEAALANDTTPNTAYSIIQNAYLALLGQDQMEAQRKAIAEAAQEAAGGTATKAPTARRSTAAKPSPVSGDDDLFDDPIDALRDKAKPRS